MEELLAFILDETSREYFCNACGQLRLALNYIPEVCRNCRSVDIIVGLVGSLDKEKLKEAFNGTG